MPSSLSCLSNFPSNQQKKKEIPNDNKTKKKYDSDDEITDEVVDFMNEIDENVKLRNLLKDLIEVKKDFDMRIKQLIFFLMDE